VTIRLFQPALAPTDDLLAALRPVFDSKYLGEGSQVQAFEAALGTHLRSRHVAAVNAGTSALWLAYHLADIRGGAVVTTPLSCLATNMPIDLQDAQIVWADVDPETGNITPETVQRAAHIAGRRTLKAIVCVDWGGTPCDLAGLRTLADYYGVPLIRDAAHYFGPLDDRPDFTALSFQAIKHVTCGDGGALVSRSPCDHAKVRLLRWFGLDRDQGASMRCTQQVAACGFKFQMNDIAAAIGLANLVSATERLATARARAAFYDETFVGTAIRPLRRTPDSACWLYSVRVPDARAFAARMAERGVEVSPVHARNDTQAVFAESRRNLPGMDELERRLVCLPIGAHLSTGDVERVAEAARECVA
jgi:dTDP-4-amino-4,6-dideoxygalactose transaminase